MPNKVEYYAKLIHQSAIKEESQSNLTEVFGDIVRQGIKKAEEELKKENDQSYEEGFMHKIPIVGSVWSWWSPPTKKDVAGKTFDLLSEKLENKSPVKPRKDTTPRTKPQDRPKEAKDNTAQNKDNINAEKGDTEQTDNTKGDNTEKNDNTAQTSGNTTEKTDNTVQQRDNGNQKQVQNPPDDNHSTESIIPTTPQKDVKSHENTQHHSEQLLPPNNVPTRVPSVLNELTKSNNQSNNAADKTGP